MLVKGIQATFKCKSMQREENFATYIRSETQNENVFSLLANFVLFPTKLVSFYIYGFRKSKLLFSVFKVKLKVYEKHKGKSCGISKQNLRMKYT